MFKIVFCVKHFFKERKMKIWGDEEVKFLFSEVEKCKDEKLPLREAFSVHAEKFGRKQNSVRNYYYADVENLKKDKARLTRLGISLDKHGKSYFKKFEKDEEEKLLKQIKKFKQSGFSVRQACEKLSGGDLAEMTRLQNKYQNLTKRKMPDNVIAFKKERLLTESDINSLFMGLVKLIRKTAVDELMEKTRIEKESSAYLLKRAFMDLNKKDKQITALRAEFENLKNENRALLEKIEESKFLKNEKLKKKLAVKPIQKLKEC